MDIKLTRTKAAVLGCSLALFSCLATSAARTQVPPRCAFELAESLGQWELIERCELQPRELGILQAGDHWRRVYQHRQTKQVVVVTLIAGPGGPLASHLPETCYARTEFRALSEPVVWNMSDHADRFRCQTLQPREVDQPALTIAYAWHDGSRWRAPQYPRFQLAGHSTLQRLLVTMRHPGGMTAEAQQVVRQVVGLTVEAAESAEAAPERSADSSSPSH
ncbi:MAG: exosortase-associated EpsI family protein [Phycisphaera sp. RhM]|nr:exosortase-associated EpsI family protein [Phycisphaera sp. RhM]